MSRNGASPGLRLRPLNAPSDYPALAVANEAAGVAAGRPSGTTASEIEWRRLLTG